MIILFSDYFSLSGLMSKILTLGVLMTFAVIAYIGLLIMLRVGNYEALRKRNLSDLVMEKKFG